MAATARFEELESTSRSPVMRKSIEKAKLYARTDNTILITGESGTGKEMFAQSIHNASNRSNQPFVGINCAALPTNLLESELFGYEEGAFTGAKRGGKPGYFELAHNGTLFLDELGLLPIHVQIQLLRVLQERQVLRIGGDKMNPINVRIIAATNSDLSAAVENGTFRQDLYFRINVLNISIPPLRDRKVDIKYLIQHFLTQFNSQYGKNVKSCSDAFISAFQQHNWPGNVRELINYLMRIIILSESETLTIDDIRKSDIHLSSPKDNKAEQINEIEDISVLQPADIGEIGKEIIEVQPDTLKNIETNIILWYMDYYKGNRAKVCEALDISRTKLWKVLKEARLISSRWG